jgi:hypothetical protein
MKSGDYAKRSWDKDVMGSKYDALKRAARLKRSARRAVYTAVAGLQQVVQKQLGGYVPGAKDPKALAASMLYRAAERRMALVENPEGLSVDALKGEEERLAVLENAAREIAKLGGKS